MHMYFTTTHIIHGTFIHKVNNAVYKTFWIGYNYWIIEGSQTDSSSLMKTMLCEAYYYTKDY
jgi:hypothetical protein